jgi:hypothetical protein
MWYGPILFKPSCICLHRQVRHQPIYSDSSAPRYIKSSRASTTALASTHPGSSSSTAPDRLHQHRPWSSSPTTIYINELHHVAAITDRGHRQRQQNLLLLLLATPRNYKKKIRV